MKIVPIKLEDIPVRRSYSDNYTTLVQFTESGYDCVEITGFTQKEARQCVASLNASIKRYRFYTVKAILRDGRVFLVKVNNK